MVWFAKKKPEILKVEEEVHKEEVKQEVPEKVVPLKVEEATKEQIQEEKQGAEEISIEQVIIATYQKTLELERVVNLLLENVIMVNTSLLERNENKQGRPKK